MRRRGVSGLATERCFLCRGSDKISEYFSHTEGFRLQRSQPCGLILQLSYSPLVIVIKRAISLHFTEGLSSTPSVYVILFEIICDYGRCARGVLVCLWMSSDRNDTLRLLHQFKKHIKIYMTPQLTAIVLSSRGSREDGWVANDHCVPWGKYTAAQEVTVVSNTLSDLDTNIKDAKTSLSSI